MSARPLALASFVFGVVACALGCSSGGQTPNCPEPPLYDVRSAEERALVKDKLIQAKSCLTLPAGLEGGASGD